MTGLSLTSNGYTLPVQQLGELQPASGSVSSLRQQLQQQGYLWLRQFLDPQEVLGFRRYFFNAFAESGLVQGDPQEGRYSGHESRDKSAKALMEMVRSARYEAFCLQPKLVGLMDELLQGPAYLHKRKIIRYTKPQDPAATGAHYDLVYLRGGTDRFCTVWIPIGDCPIEMGGLCYLENSHALGQSLERQFAEQNANLSPDERMSAFNKNMSAEGWISKDLPALAHKFGSRWLLANYQAGDVLLHSPYMIHAATTNQDPLGRLRLSTDIRYQNVRDEIDARWANHWSLADML